MALDFKKLESVDHLKTLLQNELVMDAGISFTLLDKTNAKEITEVSQVAAA